MLLDAYQTFNPKNYLTDYYSEIGPENLELLRFFAEAYQDVPSDSVMLEFSGGPTLYSLISASKNVREIHFSDFLPQNLAEVQSWLSGRSATAVWDSFFREAIRLEGNSNVSQSEIRKRMTLLRNKITCLLSCDAFEANPLGIEYRHFYDVVAANFVAESITCSKKMWQEVIAHISSTLKTGGTFIMTAIQDAKYYSVNGKHYPAVPVNEIDLVQTLIKIGFRPNNILIRTIPAEIQREDEENYKGYQGMVFVKARK